MWDPWKAAGIWLALAAPPGVYTEYVRPSETESTMLSRAAPSPKSKIGEPSFEQLAHGDWPLTEIP